MKISNLQNRSVYRDLLRIVSAIAVVCIHVSSDNDIMNTMMSSQWMALNIYDTLSRFCVPVFVMISGSFLLDLNREQPVSKLFKIKIPRQITAYLFWIVIYGASAAIELILKNQTIEPLHFIQDVVISTYHLWFIFMIVFLYAITPLLRKICEDRKLEKYFILLAMLPLAYNFITLYFSPPVFQYIFSKLNMNFVMGYTVYFLLGHYIETYGVSKKNRNFIYIVSVFSLVLTAFTAYYLKIKGQSSSAAYEYLLPNVLFPSIAIFLVFKYKISEIKFSERAVKFITWLSSLTFGIYLSHRLVIWGLRLMSVSALSFNTAFSVPILTILVFLISALISFLLNKIPVLNKYIV